MVKNQSITFNTDTNALEVLGALVLEEARKLGASAAQTAFNRSEGLSVKARNGEVDTVEHHRDKSMAVTVYFGQRKASVSSSDFAESALRHAVAAACGIARYTSEDDCAGLADAESMAKQIPELDLYHPWQLDAEQAIEHAIRTDAAALAFDSRISNSDGANVSRHQGLSFVCNTHGFCGSVPSTRHGISCSVIAGQGNKMQREFWYSASRLSQKLQNPEEVGQIASERVLARLGARPIKTGRYPILFSAEMSRSLLSSFISSISGTSLYRRNTFMLDKLEKQIFSENIHIHEDPLIPQALGSSPFDSDGLARKPRDIVLDGVLQGYVLSTYNARKLKLRSTANAGGVRNLTLSSGNYSDADLLTEMDSGLLVTEMMGQGVKLATGDYSRGASGFWVEKGKIVHPVQEVTIAGNLADMFMGIVAVGDTLDLRSNIRSPSILLDAMMVAGS